MCFPIPRSGALVLATLTAISAYSQLTLDLEPSEYNGYNISCAGLRDGAIDLTVSGGTPPYHFEWSTGASTEDVADLSAGYYRVGVTDNASNSEEAEITLTEPDGIKIEIVPYEYPNGYNISCYNCYNGSIAVTTTGGVTPYSYLWRDGATTEDRIGLGADNFQFVMTDANGCEVPSDIFSLRQPDRNDWTMDGNAGTNPPTQYLGTSDNKDVVFKTNGADRLKLLSTGEVRLPSLASGGYGLLIADGNGGLKILTGGGGGTEYGEGCPAGDRLPWLLCGNEISSGQFLGTINEMPLALKTNDVTRIFIRSDGKVGIGTVPPVGAIDQYRLFVEDGIVTRDVLVKLGTWPDYVFNEGYGLMPMDELRRYLQAYKHLPGVPSAAELEAKGGVEVGDMQRRLVKVVEEQALYILELEEQLDALRQRVMRLETSNH